MFVASRDDAGAGTEERLKAVVHPDLIEHLVFAGAATAAMERVKSLEDGAMPVSWYAVSATRALCRQSPAAISSGLRLSAVQNVKPDISLVIPAYNPQERSFVRVLTAVEPCFHSPTSRPSASSLTTARPFRCRR